MPLILNILDILYILLPNALRTTENQIAATCFDGDHKHAPFLVRVPQHPDTFWDTWALEELEVRFSAGHFELFADGTQRAAFQDADFSFIDIIGFVIEGNNHRIGRVWADAFTISGPALDVSFKTKLVFCQSHGER